MSEVIIKIKKMPEKNNALRIGALVLDQTAIYMIEIEDDNYFYGQRVGWNRDGEFIRDNDRTFDIKDRT